MIIDAESPIKEIFVITISYTKKNNHKSGMRKEEFRDSDKERLLSKANYFINHYFKDLRIDEYEFMISMSSIKELKLK